MALETEAYTGELIQLRKLHATIKHTVLAEKLKNTYFICGQAGEENSNGLPKYIYVCPAYGVDWFQVYERTDKSNGAEW